MESDGLKVSAMASSLKGSEIIKLAGEINELIKGGQKIYNFTIGDFDSNLFPIPTRLKQLIIQAYNDNQTNYPPANGTQELRNSLSEFTMQTQGLDYNPSEFLVAGGARPLIYALFQTVVDPGDQVVFPVPSWNNNHYTHLSRGNAVFFETKAENNFMPVISELEPYLETATLITLCSPLNPTGTIFTQSQLSEISKRIVDENLKRKIQNRKPLYLMYDQIYRTLLYNNNRHYDPIHFQPDLRPYTIFIDGLSKAFAATGVRVGWAFGPSEIISKMSNILGHVGAWAPKPEQVATATYLKETSTYSKDLDELKSSLNMRLFKFYNEFISLKESGFPVDAISPQAALYLTVKFDIIGKTTSDNLRIETGMDVASFLIKEAQLAVVPFSAFGANANSPWFRLSVGTSKPEEIETIFTKLKTALTKLK